MSSAPSMSENEYFESRLDDQIEWHGDKSAWNQAWSKRLQVLMIASAALIPFVSAIPGERLELTVRLVVAGLGVIAAVAGGVQGIYHFQERWIEYRTTAETLKHEKYRFLTRTEPYDGDDAFALLVQRAEELISQQNTRWQQRMDGAKGAPARAG